MLLALPSFLKMLARLKQVMVEGALAVENVTLPCPSLAEKDRVKLLILSRSSPGDLNATSNMDLRALSSHICCEEDELERPDTALDVHGANDRWKTKQWEGLSYEPKW